MMDIMRKIDRHRVLRQAGMVALMLALAVPAWAQLGQGRVQGTVTDTQGNPVEGVQVVAHNPEVSPSTLETTSDEKGRWALLGFNQAPWRFTFTKEGYVQVSVTRNVKMLARNEDVDVVLESADSDVANVRGGANVEAFREGTALFEAEDYAGAIEKWEEFLADNPTVYQVHQNVGTAYRRMGQLDKAEEHYRIVLEQDPDDTRANTALGEVLIEQGQTQEALPHFERVVEASPDDPAVFYNVGEIYFEAGKSADAVEYYKMAVEVDPEFLPAYQQLGYAYLNTNDTDNAIVAFEKYLELAPEGSEEAAVVQGILEALRESQ